MFIAYEDNNKTLFVSFKGVAEDVAERLGISDYLVVESLPSDDIDTLSIVDGKVVVDAVKVAEKVEPYKKEYRDYRINQGVLYKNKYIQTDDSSLIKLKVEADEAKEDVNYVGSWRTLDNSWISLNSAEMVELGNLARLHVRKCFGAHQYLNGTAYTSKEAVETAFDNFYNSI